MSVESAEHSRTEDSTRTPRPNCADIVRAARARGDGNASLAHVRLLANAPEATAEVFEALAQLCLEAGLTDEAAGASGRAIAGDPSQPEAWHRLGIIQMRRQNLQAARHSLEQAVR